ncbi:MAG: hypothetical protein LBH60_03740 [Prevotellaceae bacterium]|jgi:uncharacterized membrane protein|nr:hypothetical protein [Prevotellaceae bacterium]
MAKQHQQNKLSKSNRGEFLLEQNVAIDDSLLPSAVELEKLKEVDPGIIPWIMQRTEIEQNARIENNREILELNKMNLAKTHGFNKLSLILGFLLFIVTLLLAAYFVYAGLPTQGTIFGSASVLVAIVYFSKIIGTARTRK